MYTPASSLTASSKLFPHVSRLFSPPPVSVPQALLLSLSAITLGTPAAWATVEGLTPTIQAAGVRAYQEANFAAYKTVFLSTIAFCSAGIIASFWAPNVDALLTKDMAV